jgi:hypothetical protein
VTAPPGKFPATAQNRLAGGKFEDYKDESEADN